MSWSVGRARRLYFSICDEPRLPENCLTPDEQHSNAHVDRNLVPYFGLPWRAGKRQHKSKISFCALRTLSLSVPHAKVRRRWVCVDSGLRFKRKHRQTQGDQGERKKAQADIDRHLKRNSDRGGTRKRKERRCHFCGHLKGHHKGHLKGHHKGHPFGSPRTFKGHRQGRLQGQFQEDLQGRLKWLSFAI